MNPQVELFTGHLEEFIDLFHESTGLESVEAVRKLQAIEVLKGTEYGVIRSESRVVGMVGVYIDPVAAVRELQAAELIDLAVAKDFRGQGFSRMLTDWALQKAREAGEPYLWLYTGSGENLEIYRRLGFESSGVNEGYWGDVSRVWFRKATGAAG